MKPIDLGYLLFWWVAVLIWCKFIHCMKISGVVSFPLDDNPFPSMWPPPRTQVGNAVVYMQAVTPPHCGVFIQV